MSRLLTLRTMARALARQVRTPAPPRPAPLDLQSCARALEDQCARTVVVRVEARSEPWTAADLHVDAGTELTWLAHGDTWGLGRRGIHLDAAMQLRVRTGGAVPSLSGTGPTHTAIAREAGPVEICCIQPAELRGEDEQLVYDRVLPRRVMSGGFDVVLAAWPAGTEPAAAIGAAAEHDPTGLCREEAGRLASPRVPPEGWSCHPALTLAGVHSAVPDGIAADVDGQVEIIRHDVDVPLTDDLALTWRWRMDRLPSSIAEHTMLTHDYLSIAVEFDDGKDLTYYWSTELPVGFHYRCPLPHWREREWHYVVRSGSVGLGGWQAERRTIAPDRDAAIGGPRPGRVVAVWLIATAAAQGGSGHGTYADVSLVDGGSAVAVI